jgi:hypothetical protein
MTHPTELALQKLVKTLSTHQIIRAIGISGGSRPLPQPGEGDIDMFIYVTHIPSLADREKMVAPLREELEPIEIGRLPGGHWGLGDCVQMTGVETWLLFSTLNEAETEVKDILAGRYLDKLDNYYYPIGRCAMWQDMRVLYDPDGFMQSIQSLVSEYPADLQQQMLRHHLEALGDVEDLERAVRRQDVLFYHFALDLALDHFLQALFAMNGTFFPSRKRSEGYIKGFKIKPQNCEQRLRQILALGGQPESVPQSYAVWTELVKDLEALAN